VHRIFWITPRAGLDPPPGRCRDKGFIRNLEEYERFAAPIFREVKLDRDELERFAAEHQRGRVFLWLQIDGFFWLPRELLGIEPHLYAFRDQPELLHRINRDLADYTLRLIDALYGICTPDMVSIAEDMSYNKGPMISKACFDEFLAPYYRRVVPAFSERGTLPIVDSDGDLAEMIPWLEAVGIEGASPLERRAGNDIVEMRRNHPRFRMMGAFDKTVMSRGESAMRAEFERILPVMRSGGYVPSVDHQTPPDVSLADYRIYVRLLHEYCRQAAKGA
jgi:uroporphyrinogen-III decarboxylase